MDDSSQDDAGFRRKRDEYEYKLRRLVGRRIEKVSYFDLLYEGQAPEWDFRDWHLAVMGVELGTLEGPISVVWTNTFEPYGVEIFESPMSAHLSTDPKATRSWEVTDQPQWQQRLDQPIQAVSVAWDTRIYRTMREVWNKEETRYDSVLDGEDQRSLPVALQLDVAAGPLWIVAAIINGPLDEAFVGGDELTVVFSWDAMELMNLGEGRFVRL